MWIMIKVWNITRGYEKGKDIHFYSTAFVRTMFSSAVVTDRAAVLPRRQQAKPAHTDFDLCCHTAARSPSCRLMVSASVMHVNTRITTHLLSQSGLPSPHFLRRITRQQSQCIVFVVVCLCLVVFCYIFMFSCTFCFCLLFYLLLMHFSKNLCFYLPVNYQRSFKGTI